jgi:hypothetical protein
MSGLKNYKMNKEKIITYLKKIGWIGFFFFLVKGIIWLIVFYYAGKIIGK